MVGLSLESLCHSQLEGLPPTLGCPVARAEGVSNFVGDDAFVEHLIVLLEKVVLHVAPFHFFDHELSSFHEVVFKGGGEEVEEEVSREVHSFLANVVPVVSWFVLQVGFDQSTYHASDEVGLYDSVVVLHSQVRQQFCHQAFLSKDIEGLFGEPSLLVSGHLLTNIGQSCLFIGNLHFLPRIH